MIITQSLRFRLHFLRLHYSYHSYYDVLGVQHGASQQEIKRKYFQLAKKYHPDSQEGIKDPTKFIKINEAYETLGDQKKRIKYDNGFFSAHQQSQPHSTHTEYTYTEAGARRPHWNYYDTSTYDYRTPNQSFFTILKRSYWSVFFYFCYLYMGIQIFRYFVWQLDKRDREMQERLLQESPTVTRNRRKYYAKEMREKNIYGQHIDIKYRVLTKESTRSLQKKKDSMLSIEGIEKQGKPSQDTVVIKPEYI